MAKRTSAAARWFAAAGSALAMLGAGCQPKVLPSSVVATDAAAADGARSGGTDANTQDAPTASADGGAGGADGTGGPGPSGNDKEPMAELAAGSYYRGESEVSLAIAPLAGRGGDL